MLSQRDDRRMPTSPIPALIIDRTRQACADVTMHNFAWSGCCIVGKGIHEISDEIAIHFAGLQHLLHGQIIWREGKWAGVAFEPEKSEHNDKRAEKRVTFTIPAVIADLGFERRIPCTILNASRSGCQIESNDLDQFDNDIFIKIPAFDWPIKGHIMWRHFNLAGIRLMWRGEKPSNRIARPPEHAAQLATKPDSDNFFV